MLPIQRVSTRIVVVGTTLIIAVGLAAILMINRHQVVTSIGTPVINHPPERSLELPPLQEQTSPEAKAVRLAEDFITANGYTDLPPDRNKLTLESIEPMTNVDELIKWRHDSLEREAFGVISTDAMGRPGWTVVFRMKPANKEDNSWGRAVTMDAALSHLSMQHKSIFLDGRLIKRL